MSPEPVISVREVSKWFGSVVAVNDVGFDVFPGVTGLLGPNGAGKTTLLRMIAGLAAPSEGGVRVLGEQVRADPELYRRIGIMPEHESVYDFLSGHDFVELNARLQGLADPAAAADKAIAIVDLAEAADRRIGGYSRGMLQRMRLAATLVHDPVLLLDEPLSGTDPPQRRHFQTVIRRLSEEGRTIVISSHILEEIEAVADRIVLMVSGKLAAIGDYRAIRQKLNDRPFLMRVDCDDPRTMGAALLGIDGVESVEVDAEGPLRVRSHDIAAFQRALPGTAAGLGIRLTRVDPLDDSLESVFEYLAEG